MKPTANSKSWPGVRMVTATLIGSWPGPPARISIGSSVAIRSGRSMTFPSRQARARAGVTVRAEAFNVINRVNFNGPGGNNNLTVTTNAAGQAIFNSPNFGLITSAKAARFIQIVTRFDF